MSEKTEPASEKKLEDARKKGEVAQSQDLARASAFSLGVVALLLTAKGAEERIRVLLSTAVQPLGGPVEDRMTEVYARIFAMAIDGAIVVAPVVGAAIVGSLIGGFVHVGLHLSFEPLTPKFDKLNPVNGFKRIFSLKSLLEVLKSVIKAIFISWVLYELILSILPLLSRAGYGSVIAVGQSAWDSLRHLLLVCIPMFLVLGVVDFVLQRWLFLRDQRMSKDDQKTEYKQTEGDPHIKGERKALAREIAFSAPRKKAVAEANAVVVNPTHYAVALRYKPKEYGLPVIVACGVDGEALQIRLLAAEFGVPVIGNPELARALFSVGTNAPVPEPFLEAVAVVLRWADEVRKAGAA